MAEQNSDWTRSDLVTVREAGTDLDPAAIPADASDWLRELGGPTLIRQPGRDGSRTRIVSTLLHGNEPSGIRAIHRWLRDGEAPATDVLFLIVGVETALVAPGFHYRIRPGGRDLNRCWLPPFEGPEAAIAQASLRLMRESGAECLVDIHNNTGHNPAYGVGPVPGAAELNLVSLFGDRFVHSPLRLGTLVEATRDDFPSVTVECGRSGDPIADEVAYAGLRRLLALERLEPRRVVADAVQVLTDPVRVCVRPGSELAFGERPIEPADLTIDVEVDRHNFEVLAAGTAIGWLRAGSDWPLQVDGESGEDLSREYFTVRGHEIVSVRPIIPIMMTTNRDNALADCLFYIVREG